MDSWTLQGDSYSFLRSAPRTFSLCHRDGTPNHVEIFDIINAPVQRSAISETTCLCDIFGDDCESASISSSPSAGAFVPSQREVEATAAASSQVDDLNDSSGSYHTAQGSSEGEEGLEDLGDTFYSPVLQKKFPEDKQLEEKGLSSDHPQVSEENISNLEPKSVTPVPQLRTSTPSSVTPSSQGLNSGERTPSPECYSPSPFNPEGRLSSLSSSSADNRLSSTSPGLKENYSEAEPRRITPSLKENQSSPSNQSLASTSSLPQDLFEPRAGHYSENLSPSPELTHLSQDRTDSESRISLSSPLTSPSGSESKSHSGGAPVSSELRNSCPLPDARAQSPFPELRGRISLPDLFSRGSTPDIEDSVLTAELISDLSAVGKDIKTTPEIQDTRLSADPDSSVSTPGPRYTPPSPVVSVPTSPPLVRDSVSPGFGSTSTSPGLLSPASPANARSRSPSPDPSANRQHSLTFSEIGTQVSSPVVSLSPSPGPQRSSSPTEHRYTTPSPEIRITASSPEVKRKEKPSQGKSESDSPLLDPHFGSGSPRSPTSSPHITGICYSVVQPEDRNSPPFPELQRQRTPLSSEVGKGSTDSNIARSTDSSQRSTPSSVSLSEATILPQPETQTPSPRPNPLSSSPEPGYQTSTSDKVQSPSSQHRSRDQSPEVQFSEQRYQQSPGTLSTEYPLYTKPTSVRSTPEIKIDPVPEDITEIQSPTQLEKDSQSLAFELEKRETEAVAEPPSNSPVEVVCSPLSVSSDKSLDKSLTQQTTEREETIKEAYTQDRSSVDSSTEENQDIQSSFFQKEEIKSVSPNLIAPKDRNPNISPVHRATSNPPVQTQDNLNSQVISPSLNSDRSVFSPKWSHTPENSRRQLLTRVRCVNRERFTQDMSHHGNRRQTPSPPLTRFTPVHIIAPEKPYRHWQNRSRSPSQVLASSSSGNLKKEAPNRESPSFDPVDTYSQAHWVRMGRQLEMEKEMPPKQERDAVLKKKTDRGMDRETEREERAPERGEGWQGVASYRGEQVELSFSARNRKGPVSRSGAPTSRETSQALPTVHSYSESLLETRQLQQQQSLLQLPSQQDTRGGRSSRKLQPPASQNRKSAPRRLAANRPCQSSSSSMGSELDEADNEVKWLTDVAFRSLSSPEVDYLDMYNSSHCSSTNISQPSTQESPAGVNAAWLAYADFRGSAPKLDHDDHSFQQPSAHYSDSLDPSRRYELGSFECIDVALEREDCRKVRRGVPKRQIQLKRRNNAEGKQEEGSENSSPGVPTMVESPSQESHPRATFMRQHSTPAAMQECYRSEGNSELSLQKERQSKLQKSASMDETCSKTKMASCIIKNVLSKKMQSADRQPDEQASKEVSPQTESAAASLKESPKPDSRDLSSSLHSDYSLSSEGFPVREEPNTKQQAKLPKSHGVRTGNRPSSSSSGRSVTFPQTDSEEAVPQSRSSKSSAWEMKSELKVAFESKKSQTGLHQTDEREADDSANTTPWDTGASSASAASNTEERETNKDQECEHTEPHKLLQADKGAHASNTQKITLKAVEKRKASLNVCLTPEAESKPGAISEDGAVTEKEEKTETNANEKTKSEGHENNQAKAPIHKVRNVRPLVKNTYNLSFKAASSVSPSNANEEKMHGFNYKRIEEVSAAEERDVTQKIKREDKVEEQKGEVWMERKAEQIENAKDSDVLMLPPTAQNTGSSLSGQQPMQIEYRAVCWKDEKNQTSSIKNNLGDKTRERINSLGKESPSLNANTSSQTTGDKVVQEVCEYDISIAAETQKTMKDIHKESDSEVKPVMTRTDRKPPMLGSLPKLPSKEREVSTAVVLIREKTNKTNKSASSAQEEPPASIQVPAPASLSPGPISPGSTSGSGGHSVSMLLKERGYQADIGAVVGDNQNPAGAKGVPRKHVNCLEIPLQTLPPSHGGSVESHRERTFSSSSTTSGPSAVTDNTDVLTKPREDEGVHLKSEGKDTTKHKINPEEQHPSLTKQKDMGDFEAVKRIDPTFPPRSPAIRKFKPQVVEVNSLSKETQKQEMPTNSMGNQRPQTIEVKSIAKSSQKPAVPPKPNCKFKPADLGATPHEAQRPSATLSSPGKPQSEERPQTIVVSSPTIYRKISNESTSASNYSRKLTVSAVSSLKLPPHKTTATDSSSQTNQSRAQSDTEATSDKVQHQQSAASPQSSRNAQKPASSSTTPAAELGVTSALSLVTDPEPSHITGAIPSGSNQSALVDQFPRAACLHDPPVPGTSNNTKQLTGASSTKVQRFANQPCSRSLSSERAQRLDNLRFYASDDPPSYDERESFSPLLLPDLAPLRSNRCQPSYRPPPCSCAAGCPSHSGHTSPHHHCSPHNFTPPVPPNPSGQTAPYQVGLPPLHPHQCRPDPQPMNYQPGSPKSSPLGPNQPPSMYQPLHQSAACPPHPSLMQAFSSDRSLPPQHVGPRRPPVHRSPHQQPPNMAGGPYSDPGHNHSPVLPSMDHQYLCGPQTMGSSYGSDYGADGSSLYSESGYGQTPRRVLLDPETGKYFYIEVPVQPLRKMLFDPETGQYVEVLIPQQAMSHSSLYPPSAAPFPPLHNPNMYAPAPQCMPCAAPPPVAHPKAQPQPPQYPEASAAAAMHPSRAGVSYRNPSGQGYKPEPQNHPPLDHSYLENMYYVPTGMNASPNPTPPDYYHKHPPNMPPTGGKRS